MRKQFLTIAIVFTFLSANAQKGLNTWGVGADAAFPVGDFNNLSSFGFGGYLKGLYGVGASGQLTFTYSYTSFKVKEDLQNMLGVDKLNVRIMPFMFGYRQNFKGIYLEPQVGYGIYSARARLGGVSGSDSDGAFAWTVGGGASMGKGLDLGISYQNLTKDSESTSWISLRLGYNFSFGK